MCQEIFVYCTCCLKEMTDKLLDKQPENPVTKIVRCDTPGSCSALYKYVAFDNPKSELCCFCCVQCTDATDEEKPLEDCRAPSERKRAIWKLLFKTHSQPDRQMQWHQQMRQTLANRELNCQPTYHDIWEKHQETQDKKRVIHFFL